MNVVFGDLLPHPTDPGRNALLLSVPQSASAPHMVDGQYWGRSADGKRPLSDVEVARLFAERRLAADDFEAKLRAITDELDPVPTTERQLVHFSVLVRPVMPPRDGFIEQIEARERFVSVLSGARQGFIHSTDRYPTLLDLGRRYAHPDGPAWEGIVNLPRAAASPYDVAFAETQFMRLLVGHDGAVCVAAARGSYPLTEGGTQIDFAYIVSVLHQVMALAGFLGRGVMSYDGMWRVGVHVSGTSMRGHLGYPPGGFHTDRGQPLAMAEYVRTAAASTADLADDAVPVVDRVLRNLARASGLLGDLRRYMSPETTPLG